MLLISLYLVPAMRFFFGLLLTIYVWSVAILSYMFTFLICYLISPFVTEKTIAKIHESIPAYLVVYSMCIPGFWKLEIRDNRSDKNWNNRYIFIANHMSFIDSALIMLLPQVKKFLVARFLSYVPCFSWLSHHSGYIFIDRNDKSTTINAVNKAIKNISDGSSLCLFPEGIREKIPYKLEEFKTGAFRISFDQKIPILPITLIGTEKAISKRGWANTSKLYLIIDEPFLVEDDDYKKYMDNTKNIMEKNILKFK